MEPQNDTSTQRRSRRWLTAAGAAAAAGLMALLAVIPAGASGGQDTTSEGRDGRRPVREWFQSLTDEQQQCLRDEGLHRLHHRPTRADIRRARAALDACGIEAPFAAWRAWVADARAAVRHATPEQRTCLREAGLTRPHHRPRSAEQIRERIERFAEVAQQCGIELPPLPTS